MERGGIGDRQNEWSVNNGIIWGDEEIILFYLCVL